MTDDEIRQCEYAIQDCIPEVIDAVKVYEAGDEPSTDFIYNCERCDCINCEYWESYN